MKAKRFLSILLAVMLAFSCVAITATADGTGTNGTTTSTNDTLYDGTSTTSTDYTYELTIKMYATDTDDDIKADESYTYGSEPSSGTVVAGIKYDIYYSSSYAIDATGATLIGTVTTNTNGEAYFYTNTAGWYVCVPSTEQEDYVTSAPTTFTVYLPVDENTNTTTVYPKTIVTGALQFTKYWNTTSGTTVPSDVESITFKVYDKTAEEYIYVTGSNGVYTVSESTASGATQELTYNTGDTISFVINGLTVGHTYEVYETSITAATGATTTYTVQTSALASYTISTAGSSDGSSTAGTVYTGSYTNVSSSTPTVEKEVKGSGDNDYVQDTDIDDTTDNGTADWKITANFPADITTNYTKYVVTDTLSDYLVAPSENDITITYYDSNGDAYTLSSGSARVTVSGQQISVDFTSVISYLPAGGYAEITFSTTFSSSYTYGTKVYNGAMITYINNTSTEEQKIDNNNKTDNDANDTGDSDDSSDPSIWSGKLTVTKTNSATGETITSGTATFAVYKENSTTSGYSDDDTEITTNLVTSNGVATLTGLDAGTYYIVETAAPTGYTLTNKVTTVTISDADTGRTVSVEIENTPNTNLPLTGGSGLYLIVGLGLALVAVGGYMFFRRKRTA